MTAPSHTCCCVPGCPSGKRTVDVNYHKFPHKDKTVQWTGKSGIKQIVNKRRLWEIKLKMDRKITDSMAVCSRHFLEEDYYKKEGKQKHFLKQTAVPSQNLPQNVGVRVRGTRTYSDEKPFQCQLCKKTYKLESYLNKHLQVHEFKCKICKKAFLTSKKLKAHSQIHLPKDIPQNPYKCVLCNKRYLTIAVLKVHLHNHKSFTCEICSEKFMIKAILQRHLHTCGKVFTCKICHMKIAQLSAFNEHLKVHEENKTNTEDAVVELDEELNIKIETPCLEDPPVDPLGGCIQIEEPSNTLEEVYIKVEEELNVDVNVPNSDC